MMMVGALLGFDWPTWLGTPLQGGSFLLLTIIAIRTSPAWLTTWSTMRLAKSNANATRIATLEKRIEDCHAECKEETDKLRGEIHGLRAQRNAEQLVVMRSIVGMSNDPAVKTQLALLEAMELSLKKGAEHERMDNEGP